jgi:hypothetical protein
MYGDVPDEDLPVRTLKELKVPEIGPVTWPAYADTSVGMRSTVIDLGRIQERDPEQLKLLARAVFIADTAQQDDSQRSDAPAAGERQESDDAQQDAEQAVEHPSNEDEREAADQGDEEEQRLQLAAQQVGKRPSQGRTDAQRSTPAVGERPSNPRRLTDKNLRLMNQRDRLLNLRSVGDRAL